VFYILLNAAVVASAPGKNKCVFCPSFVDTKKGKRMFARARRVRPIVCNFKLEHLLLVRIEFLKLERKVDAIFEIM
jgi:hypothetical protein